MNDFNFDPNLLAAFVRDAQRMRGEAVGALLTASWARLRGLGTSIGTLARALQRRRKWNLSVPAPHR